MQIELNLEAIAGKIKRKS